MTSSTLRRHFATHHRRGGVGYGTAHGGPSALPASSPRLAVPLGLPQPALPRVRRPPSAPVVADRRLGPRAGPHRGPGLALWAGWRPPPGVRAQPRPHGSCGDWGRVDLPPSLPFPQPGQRGKPDRLRSAERGAVALPGQLCREAVDQHQLFFRTPGSADSSTALFSFELSWLLM